MTPEPSRVTLCALLKSRIAKGAAVVMGVAWLLSGSACGKKNELPEASPFTVDQVREAFGQETGDKLIVERTGRDVSILGDVTMLGVARELDKKYGDFGITVFGRLGAEKRKQLDGGRSPDNSGIIWQHHIGENEGDVPVWSAGKYYGNVALTWFHESRKTNAQWERLDGALSRLSRE